jgi:hypothetical protein
MNIAKRADQKLRREGYWELVNKTAQYCDVDPEVVNKVIRKFWWSALKRVIFGLDSVKIQGFGKFEPDAEHKKNRLEFLRIRKKIFNRRTDAIDTRRERKTKRTLLFSIKHQ